MQPLKLNKKLLTLVGVCKTPDDTLCKRILFKLIGITIIVALFYTAFSSTWYIIRFISVDLAGSLGVILQIGACSGGLYTLANAFRFSTQFFNIFAKLQKIYHQSKFKLFHFSKAIIYFREIIAHRFCCCK